MRDKNYDRLWKMRTIFDKQDYAYSKYYNPTEHLALNEIIVLFKVTLVCKNWSCIPKKRHKRFGIKLCMLCDFKGFIYTITVLP